MNARGLLLTALALAVSLPAAALAQSVPSADPGPVTAAANAYFAALNDIDQIALSRVTTPGFHIVEPGGKNVTAADFLSPLYANRLDSSGPRLTLKVDVPALNGKTATAAALMRTFDYRILDGESMLEWDISEHKLAFSQVDGKWLVSEDRITSARHFE